MGNSYYLKASWPHLAFARGYGLVEAFFKVSSGEGDGQTERETDKRSRILRHTNHRVAEKSIAKQSLASPCTCTPAEPLRPHGPRGNPTPPTPTGQIG